MTAKRASSARRSGRESGQVLLVALVTMLLVGVAVSLVAASLALESRHAIEEGKRVRVTAIADAAVAEALANLAVDRGFPGRPGGALGGGTYESIVRSVGAGVLEIRVTARVGGLERLVRVEARIVPGGPRVRRWQRLSRSDP